MLPLFVSSMGGLQPRARTHWGDYYLTQERDLKRFDLASYVREYAAGGAGE
jgi:hypothetical protein